MASNRQIADRLWEDAINENWTSDERLVWVFLLSNSSVAVCGLYEVAIGTIGHYTGIGSDRASRAVVALQKRGKIVYDAPRIFVVKYAENQNMASTEMLRKNVERTTKSLSTLDNKAVIAFIEKHWPIINSSQECLSRLHKAFGQGFIVLIDTLRLDKSLKGDSKGGKKKEPREDYLAEANPDLRSEPFDAAWREWIEYRAETGKPVTDRAATKQFKQLLRIRDPALRIQCIETSMANQWQGIFPEKFIGANAGTITKQVNGGTYARPNPGHYVTPERLEHIARQAEERERRRNSAGVTNRPYESASNETG